MELHLKKYPKGHYKIIFFLFFLTLFTRLYVFQNFYVFSNDDLYYIDWIQSVQEKKPFKFDDTPIFPPGYPAILMLERQIFGSYFTAKLFEHVILLSFVPIICLHILREMKINVDRLTLFIIFMIPITIIGTSTVNITTEVWYFILVNIGLIFLLRFLQTLGYPYLVVSSILFSTAYLIRPEALIYFLSLSYIFYASRKALGRNFYLLSVKALFLVLPLLSIVVPMTLFLTRYFNSFTVIGKYKMNNEIANEISDDLFSRFFENGLGLFRVFVAPMFLGPTLLILILLFLFSRLAWEKALDLKLQTLLIPTIGLTLMSLYFYPMARPLIPALPSLVALGALGWDSVKNKFGIRGVNTFRLLLSALLLVQSIFPFASSQLFESSAGYYEAINGLDRKITTVIFSREPTMSLYRPKLTYCESSTRCVSPPEYLLLSNSDRAKLNPKSEIELTGRFTREIIFNGIKYRKIQTTKGSYEPVYTYRRI